MEPLAYFSRNTKPSNMITEYCKCKNPKEDYRHTKMYEPYVICTKCSKDVKNPTKWNN